MTSPQPPRRTPVKRRKRRTSFTGRAAILAVVLAALAIALAGPLRELIAQRGQIAAAKSDIATSQKQLKSLQAQEKQWNDPAYVAAQARERLHYVKPGVVPYITLGPTSAPTPGAVTPQAPDQPWYAQLWSSIQGADAAGAGASPSATPAPTATPSATPGAGATRGAGATP